MKKKVLLIPLALLLALSLVVTGCPAAPTTAPEAEAEITKLEADIAKLESSAKSKDAEIAKLKTDVAAAGKIVAPEVFELKGQCQWAWGAWEEAHSALVIERIEEVTQGRVTIDLEPPGAIVPTFDAVDAAERGVLDVANNWLGVFTGKNKVFSLFASACGGPFGLDNWDVVGWMFLGEPTGYELMRESFAEVGYKNIEMFITKGEFSEPLGWFNKPITSWEDLDGLKMRVAGMSAEVYEEAGCSVMTIPGGEIVPNLEKGLIDSAEYSDPHTDSRLGIQDINKYYHGPGIHQPTGFLAFFFNKDVWNTLPTDLQNIVEVCCHERMWLNNEEEYQWGIEAVEDLTTNQGVTLCRVSDDILYNLLAAWDKVAAEECAVNPLFKKVYDSQREFAEKLVPYKNFWFYDYSFTADYYWGEVAPYPPAE